MYELGSGVWSWPLIVVWDVVVKTPFVICVRSLGKLHTGGQWSGHYSGKHQASPCQVTQSLTGSSLRHSDWLTKSVQNQRPVFIFPSHFWKISDKMRTTDLNDKKSKTNKPSRHQQQSARISFTALWQYLSWYYWYSLSWLAYQFECF